jgi:saccharopine dehydrogenase-like NADP-dependent oxidoreductase
VPGSDGFYWILLLGSGKIGLPAALLLAGSGDYAVHLATDAEYTD